MAMAMATMAYTDDSMPSAVPDSTVVAGPVRVASAISCTGRCSVPVKYSVRRLTAWARMRPIDDGAEALPALVVVVVADVARAPGRRCRAP